MGYRCSPQDSTKYTPYELMYGRPPLMPTAFREQFSTSMDFSDPTAAAAELARRAAFLEEKSFIAGNNLLIAQHRDTLRYAYIRGGGYSPRIRSFSVGDFVYLKTGNSDVFLAEKAPRIYRVVQVRNVGTLKLQGKCGGTFKAHTENCLPCHLGNIDPTLDIQLADIPAETACKVCGMTDGDASMLLCDKCNVGYHSYCLKPPMLQLPPEEQSWFCPHCAPSMPTPTNSTDPAALTPAQEQMGLEASRLDGLGIACKFRGKNSKERVWVKGILQYRGPEYAPLYLTAKFENGVQQQVRLREARALIRNSTQVNMAVVNVPTLYDLPDTWDLTQPEQTRTALETLMPGTYDPAHVTKLAKAIRETTNLAVMRCVETTTAEVDPLLAVMDFTTCFNILDPWSGTLGVSRAFRAHNIHLLTNDINPAAHADFHADALQPHFYRSLRKAAPLDTIVMSPWFAFLDLAIPLAALAAEKCVCVHVPGHYFTNGFPARFRWLQSWADSDRLHFIWGLPRGPAGMRCGWLMFFRTPEIKREMVRAKYLTPITTTLLA